MVESLKRIILTGGGSAGHVTPNVALITLLKQKNWDIHYLGSQLGIEHQLITPLQVTYHAIPTGKLRRYFSWQNFIDPFKVILGILKSTYLCFRLKPNVIFSKGGFVSLPVVIGAWLNGIPVVLHESDLSPGLANKLCFPFAKKICLSFAKTKDYIKATYRTKTLYTGAPIRESLLHGDKQQGLAYTKLSPEKPILLVICGSLGSQKINTCLRESLPKLLEQFAIIHLCGKGNLAPELNQIPNYVQFEFVSKQLGNLLACSDLVLSRSGSNALYELLSLHKPHLLIPLQQGSRGDQIENAEHFAKQGFSCVLAEDKLTSENLIKSVKSCFEQRLSLQKKLDNFPKQQALATIMSLLQDLTSLN